MTYDMDALRAAEKVAAFFVAHAAEAETAERNRSTTEDGHELKADDFYLYEEAVAVRTILAALPSLIDDAALGRAAPELLAEAIYNEWSYQEGWVPWVGGGNSFKQDDARQKARALIAMQEGR